MQTCEPVSIDLMVYPVKVFLNFMFLSAVPPPEAKRPCWCGDQATALTAAIWSENLNNGLVDLAFHIINLLSLPPEHNCCSSGDHFKPQIYCLCPWSLAINGELQRRSLCKIVLSLEPVLRTVEFHAIDPTLLECPWRTLTFLSFAISQICTSPLFVPIEKLGPLTDHPTDVTVSDNPKSHNLVTLEFYPFHK